MFQDCSPAVWTRDQSLSILGESQFGARVACLSRAILAVLVCLLVDGAVNSAAGQSTKTLRGECNKLYKSWQKRVGYGAFAAGNNGACGFSHGYPTRAAAQKQALWECRKSGSKGCTILAERSRPKSSPQTPNLKGESAAISLKAFQAKFDLSPEQMKSRFGAAGKVVCPFSSGTVFLAGRPDVFVTSDHIFIDMKRKGKPRGDISKCWIQFFFSKQRYAIKPSSVIHGLKTNKTAYQFVWYDWVVGQIDRPVSGVAPLEPITLVPGNNVTVSVVSQGMNDAVPRVCTGLVTSAFGNYGLNDITTDCSTGPGASGGPVILGSLESNPTLPLKVIALTWGTKSMDAETSNHVAMPISDGELQTALQKLIASLGHERATIPAAPAVFLLDLQMTTDFGKSCKVVYGINNRSKSDISQVSVSFDYTNDFGHPPVSETTKIESAYAGQTVKFEQTVPMLCSRISEVALNSIRSVTPEIDYGSIESLMQNVSLETHEKTIRMMKYNGSRDTVAR